MKQDQLDTRAMLEAAFGPRTRDILMNNTSGRYLSDMIEELIESRVKQEREACANIAVSWSDKSYEAEQIAAEIKARSAG
ncbi:regulator of extracellular matrix RemA (YlzA/DUF370 family) [Variovorax paradoxus]|uniref:hypothetical protein n=1 Tax=Variovorax paradoxus TaxID=34073 RepID=UPI00278FF196|nr:hypothetical protein [Variovorax paradoxus]MDQ0571465.1 regulator of extracellular matrix RemA (YlzA/DUF370 family) [Variovorax paradoxus]